MKAGRPKWQLRLWSDSVAQFFHLDADAIWDEIERRRKQRQCKGQNMDEPKRTSEEHCRFTCTCWVDFCECRCPQCKVNNQRMLHIQRMNALRQRLKDAGILPCELAELLWRENQPALEAMMEKVGREVMRQLLSDVHVQTTAKLNLRRDQ